MKINGSLIFDASSASEIQNLRVQKVASNPVHVAADIGRLIYNTGDNVIYIGGASNWVALATGGNAAALQSEVDAIETSLGAIVGGNGVFVPGQVTILGAPSTATNLTGLLGELAAAISGKDALAELVDVNVAGVADNSLLQFNQTSGKWEDSAIGADSGVQAYDAGLDALAAKSSTGVMVQTGADTFASVSLVAPAEGITITNADGVAGNPTFALANDLAAIEGLTGAGYVVRTANNTAAVRSIESGLTGTVIVGAGDGVSGNTTLDLQTLTIPTNGGALYKFNYDTYGRVTAVKSVETADITGLVDAVYVNVAGDSMTGNLNMGGFTVTGLAAPSAASDAVSKNYVDNLVAGMTWEAPVGNIVADVTARDALSLTAGARVYVAADNKIYTYNGTVFDAGEVVADGGAFFNSSTDTGYVYNGVDLVPFSGGGALVAGNGLLMTGNQLDVNFGAGITMLPSDEVGVHIHNYTGSALGFALAADGGRVATESAAVSGDLLKLFLDGSSLIQSGTGLKVAANGITEVEFNSSALATNAGLTGGSGTKLAVNADGTTLELSTNVLQIKDNGVTTAKILNANVTNAKLQFSTVTISDGTLTDDVALGETLIFEAGNGITTTVSANKVQIAVDAADIALGDLANVGTASPAVAGSALIADGTSWDSRKIFHKEVIAVAAATWTVNHALGQQFVNVTVMAETGTPGEYEVVIPQSITMTTANQVVITFNTAIAGAVAVMGIA